MGRLDFAPKINDIKVTDIKRGLGEFIPKPDKPASFAALKTALKKAGYTLASAEIIVAGSLVREGSSWFIEADDSKQRFALEGGNLNETTGLAEAGTRIEITGDWQTAGNDKDAREVIRPRAAKKVPLTLSKAAAIDAVQVSIDGTSKDSDLFFSSVRTTNPGLTVYKGGAVMPRYFFVRQHLGNLKVNRHVLRVAVSYTPTPVLQLEAEVPVQKSSFDDGTRAGSGSGFGNITVWGKYRFYRALETWGDKQAALRFGLELPTGKKSTPEKAGLAEPEFVRQQLSPIGGGVAFHTDVSYSQAHGRIVYGANAAATMRAERAGFRTGHEARINTDLEYVLLPVKYQSPGKELFVLLETSYVYHSRGRIFGREVPGSSSSEFYLAPGLQFIATPRMVIEVSYQFPVIHNTGPLTLRTDKSVLLGVRYLY